MAKHNHIYWYSLSEHSEGTLFVSNAMRELLMVLTAGPLDLHICAEPMPVEMQAKLLPHLQAPDLYTCLQTISKPSAVDTCAVLVSCDPDQPLARAARSRLPHARWGFSVGGIFSLVYCPGNKHVLWHEFLHLLGAQDHYDLHTFATTCELPSCIMQYAPSESTVGQGPFLCQQTSTILQRSYGGS